MSAIPRLIHQIWIGTDPIPQESTDSIVKLASSNGYEYKLWTDVEISTLKLELSSVYYMSDTENKYHIAAYEILKRLGGIYIHYSYTCVNIPGFSTLLTNLNSNHVTFFIGFEPPSEHVGSLEFVSPYFMGGMPECKFIHECFTEVTKRLRSDSSMLSKGIGKSVTTKIVETQCRHLKPLKMEINFVLLQSFTKENKELVWLINDGIFCEDVLSAKEDNLFCIQNSKYTLKGAIKGTEALVINLAHRGDRWIEAQEALSPLVHNLIRVDGVIAPLPHQGCGIAHCKAVKSRLSLSSLNRIVTIFEDDAYPKLECNSETLYTLTIEAEKYAEHFHAIMLGPAFWPFVEGEKLDGKFKETLSPMFVEVDIPSRILCNLTAMIYSYTIVHLLDEYQNLLESGMSFPIDRLLCSDSWGPYKFKNVRIWIPKYNCPLFSQRGSFSDNDGSYKPEFQCFNQVFKAANKPIPSRHIPLLSPTINVGVTVVTAFFKIPSKQPAEFYMHNAEKLLGNVQAHMIIFTAKEFSERLSNMRKLLPTTIYELEVDEFGEPINPVKSWFSDTVWKENADYACSNPWTKNISPQLLRLWLCKSWFVQMAIKRNRICAESEFVTWCDIGCIRHDDFIERLRWWPSVTILRSLSKYKSDPCIFLPQRKYIDGRLPVDLSNYHTDSVVGAAFIAGTPTSWSFVLDDMKHAASFGLKRKTLYDETLFTILSRELLTQRYQLIPWGIEGLKDWEWHSNGELKFQSSWYGGILSTSDHCLGRPMIWPFWPIPFDSTHFQRLYSVTYGFENIQIDLNPFCPLLIKNRIEGEVTWLEINAEVLGCDPKPKTVKTLSIFFRFAGIDYVCNVPDGSKLGYTIGRHTSI